MCYLFVNIYFEYIYDFALCVWSVCEIFRSRDVDVDDEEKEAKF